VAHTAPGSAQRSVPCWFRSSMTSGRCVNTALDVSVAGRPGAGWLQYRPELPCRSGRRPPDLAPRGAGPRLCDHACVLLAAAHPPACQGRSSIIACETCLGARGPRRGRPLVANWNLRLCRRWRLRWLRPADVVAPRRMKLGPGRREPHVRDHVDMQLECDGAGPPCGTDQQGEPNAKVAPGSE
jgi:hypothetical protein